MFGRIRVASSSSLESLERPSSKILKDDSFSIYEATLMKLKLGSQRNLNSPSNEAGEVDTEESESMQMEDDSASATSSQEGLKVVSSFHEEEELMAVDGDCYSQRMRPSSIDSHSMGSSKRQNKSTVSVLYLFSKFRSAQNAVNSSSGDADEIEKGYSVSNSPSFSSCFSDSSSTEEQLEWEFVTSLPVSPM